MKCPVTGEYSSLGELGLSPLLPNLEDAFLEGRKEEEVTL